MMSVKLSSAAVRPHVQVQTPGVTPRLLNVWLSYRA